MCGRFVLKTLRAVLDQFDARQGEFEWAGSYNVAPTQSVAVVRAAGRESGRREVVGMHWGLIPSWAKDPAIGNKMINARAETLAERPAFRGALEQRRCLIPADGFYEWKKEGKGKRPFYIRRKDGQLLAMTGLWERWTDDAGRPLESCTVITTGANELMRGIHERMPAIVPPGSYERWLTSKEPTERVRAMLRPMEGEELEAYEVGSRVNRPANNDAECIAPAGKDPESLFG